MSLAHSPSVDFAKADAIRVKALPWLVVVPGLLLTVVAGTILVVGRRRPHPA